MDKHHIFDARFKCFKDIFSAAKAAKEKGYEFMIYEDSIYFWIFMGIYIKQC